MTEITSIQRRYALTIPKSVREKIRVKEGMEILWLVRDGKIILVPKSFKVFHERFEGKPNYETEKDKEEAEKSFIKEISDQQDLR